MKISACRFIPLILYVFIFSAHTIVVKIWITNNDNDSNTVTRLSPLLISIVEFIKALVSCIGFAVEKYKENTVIETVQNIQTSFILHEWKFIVPAVLYALYNNISFVNIGHYDPQVYTVLMNVRIVFTAALWRWVFSKPISVIVYISLFILIIGCMAVNIDCHKLLEANTSLVHIGFSDISGILWIMLQAILSCSAGIFNELLLKSKHPDVDDSLNRQNFVLYSWGFLINTTVISLQRNTMNISHRDFGVVFCVIVGLLVVGGLCAAHILKHFSAIVKSYATATEILLTGVLGHFLLGISLNLCFWFSFALITIALILYNTDIDDSFFECLILINGKRCFIFIFSCSILLIINELYNIQTPRI